ncbi:hypothetical protein DH2020_041269 [Rehmannia glutinosa]|uniref:Uncharacterized protein n=1 Tax=Rehmannia glutinosa TaxID=99300 RepID=A0ABR0USS3_REHGL
MASVSLHLPENPKSEASNLNYSNPETAIRKNLQNKAIVNGADIRLLFGCAESDKFPSDVRKRAMDATDSSGRRIAIADVVSKASLKLNQAQKTLQALAADTNGFLEVSDEGGVVYVFSKYYRLKLAAKFFRVKIESLLKKGKMAVVSLVKISFGMSLAASSVIPLILAVPGIIAYKSYFAVEFIRKAFSYFCSGKLIEDVFSIVFGDGDPNQGIEEKRWKMIGQYIALNGGVVAAEELAPYLDLETTEKMLLQDDDSYMLPVLLRFEGKPKVDEEGNILYHFPSVQCTAAPQRTRGKEYVERWADSVIEVKKFLKEKKWKFSKVDAEKSRFVIFLLGYNLLILTVLGALFAEPIIGVLWNKARKQRAKVLELPDLPLKRKILSARDMARRTSIGIYSSERELYDEQDDYERRGWDQRFQERGDSVPKDM